MGLPYLLLHLAREVALNRNTIFDSLIGMAQKLGKLGLVYRDNKVYYLADEEGEKGYHV